LTFLTGPQPAYAYNPHPFNNVDNVDFGGILSWNPGQNALWHNVYFGTNFDKVQNATVYNFSGVLVSFAQDANFYNPGRLDFDQTYYWRIEEINENGIVPISNMWTFKTGSQPVKAYNPFPFDTAQEVSPDVILNWSPGKNAVSHDVYFFEYGFSDPVFEATRENPLGVLVSENQDANFYDPQGMLHTQAQCYWRIDEVDSNGIITTGDIWEFKVHEYKGRACFIGQTPAWIDGKSIHISKAQIGQSINSLSEIEEVQAHQGTFVLYDILLESGNSITVAENHIFMTDTGMWCSLHNLKASMKLKTANGSVEIKSITKQQEPFTGKVYNLKIKDSDTYMVGQDNIIVRDY
jgi:hypothetical protein